MIIIETKTWTHMINERETIGCSFDKAKGEAFVTYNRDPREILSFHEGAPTRRTEYPSVTFTDVEDVIYVTDQNSSSYRYQGRKGEILKYMSGDSPLTDNNRLTDDEINELRKELRKLNKL